MPEGTSPFGHSTVVLTGVIKGSVRQRGGADEAGVLSVEMPSSAGAIVVDVELRGVELVSAFRSSLVDGVGVLITGSLYDGDDGLCVAVEDERGHDVRVLGNVGGAGVANERRPQPDQGGARSFASPHASQSDRVMAAKAAPRTARAERSIARSGFDPETMVPRTPAAAASVPAEKGRVASAPKRPAGYTDPHGDIPF